MKPNILIITANFYEDISSDLSAGAIVEVKAKAKFKKIVVPGVFEIPVIIARNIKKYDAFIALGCVIKGKTPHFKIISKSVINAIMNLSVYYKKPIGNGIITCFNKKQAIERSRSKKNKGREAAKAVLSVLKNF
jgi:6,7-dimethyl-8-ribityllumazine synthase|tara:strand:- start:346 stop:747 length:402 start_codon:yes stop_codon:yes gene_type:complete